MVSDMMVTPQGWNIRGDTSMSALECHEMLSKHTKIPSGISHERVLYVLANYRRIMV